MTRYPSICLCYFRTKPPFSLFFFPYFNSLLFFPKETIVEELKSLHTFQALCFASLAQCSLLLLYTIYRYPFLDNSAYLHLHRTSSTENTTRSSGRSHLLSMKAIIPRKPQMLGFLMFAHHPKTAWVLKMFTLETQTPYASFASLLFIYTKTAYTAQ